MEIPWGWVGWWYQDEMNGTLWKRCREEASDVRLDEDFNELFHSRISPRLLWIHRGAEVNELSYGEARCGVYNHYRAGLHSKASQSCRGSQVEGCQFMVGCLVGFGGFASYSAIM